MKEKIKKYIGEIALIVGSFISTYNLFDFRTSRFCGINLSLDNDNCPVSYYYNDNTLTFLSIGVVFIIIGLLIIKQKSSQTRR